MFKKLLFVLCIFLAGFNIAFAAEAVDVNKADAAQLDTIKGIGPAMSKLILDERKKSPFKDWTDLQTRVKGIGDKRAVKLSEAGLTVNGEKKTGATAAASTKKEKEKK